VATTMKRKETKRKLLLSLLIVGILGSLASLATWSAFSDTTANSANSFDAGSVTLTDNDSGAFMYQVTGAKPGVTTVKCITVSYSGNLDADVKLYTTTTTIPSAAQNINLTIEKGTAVGATFPGCGTYTSQATIYNGNLYDFQQNKGSYANGVSAYPASATKWVTGDSLVYRFTVSVSDAGNGVSSGAHQFTWEARNQ
jgi:predicted ribosomally synthesized peptide with SipW-like signal peptide